MSNIHTPLFIVITPTYNRANLLKRAVESITTQKYQNWRLYICDDASTDNTQEVIDSYSQEKRIIPLKMPINSGVNKTRNAMLDQIQRDKVEGYVTLLDDDDYFVDDFFLHLGILTHQHPEEKWILTNCIYSNNKKITRIKKYGRLSYIDDYMYGKNIRRDACHTIHTSLILKTRFTERFKNAEEWYFYCLLSNKSAIWAENFDATIKEYLPEGLSKSGYNLDKKIEILNLKIDTLTNYVDKNRLSNQYLSLTRELIKAKRYSEAKLAIRNISLNKKISFNFLRYKINLFIHKKTA